MSRGQERDFVALDFFAIQEKTRDPLHLLIRVHYRNAENGTTEATLDRDPVPGLRQTGVDGQSIKLRSNA
jgi:hypothetical protein